MTRQECTCICTELMTRQVIYVITRLFVKYSPKFSVCLMYMKKRQTATNLSKKITKYKTCTFVSIFHLKLYQTNQWPLMVHAYSPFSTYHHLTFSLTYDSQQHINLK